MKPTKLRPYAFLIHPLQAKALQALKERDGVPHGVSIRRALDRYLQQQGVLKPVRKKRG
jgi:hypothetical protein